MKKWLKIVLIIILIIAFIFPKPSGGGGSVVGLTITSKSCSCLGFEKVYNGYDFTSVLCFGIPFSCECKKTSFDTETGKKIINEVECN